MSNRTTSANANADALFANRTLDEIRDVEARTRKEANEKAEALRWEKTTTHGEHRRKRTKRTRMGGIVLKRVEGGEWTG